MYDDATRQKSFGNQLFKKKVTNLHTLAQIKYIVNSYITPVHKITIENII